MEDKKITQSVVKRYNQYAKWYDKMEEKGFTMDPRATNCRISIQQFANRFDELAKQNKEISNILREDPHATVRKFKGTILEEMKSRSFAGGTRKQVNAMYETLKGGMEDLKATDIDLYNKLNEKYNFESYKDKDLAYMEMKGAGLMNKNRYWQQNGEDGGIFDLLYMDLINEANIKLHFNSPD